MQHLYRDNSYFQNPDFDSPETGGYHGYREYMKDREQIEEKFSRVLANVECFRDLGRLLDVGSGPGLLLRAARARGWDPVGVDLNPWAAEFALTENLDVRTTSLREAGFEAQSFDAITMMDLLEHVADPAELVAEAARLMRPGAVLAVLTPDAGSPVSRLLGRRWPELQRAPEHLTLMSVRGLSSLLEAHGLEVLGWHWMGKRTTINTLIADVSPIAPDLGRRVARWAAQRPFGQYVYNLNPLTKFCLYARRPAAEDVPAQLLPEMPPLRLPRRLPRPVTIDEAILEDLQALSRAHGLCDWMFEQYEPAVRGRVLEVGAGIGTFTDRILAHAATNVVLVEPEAGCASILRDRYAADPRVEILEETLPDSPTVAAAAGTFDLVVCQNVLEHIDDHLSALKAMASALLPQGQLTLLVPAHPRLYGALDQQYGHHRRYTPELLRRLAESADLEIIDLYEFNLLGIPGWWTKNRQPGKRVGRLSLLAYELLLRLWKPIERRNRPRWGLSLVMHARRAR